MSVQCVRGGCRGLRLEQESEAVAGPCVEGSRDLSVESATGAGGKVGSHRCCTFHIPGELHVQHVRLAFISADHPHVINKRTEEQRGSIACPRFLS